MQSRVREFLDRMGHTVCEPLPFESLRDILRIRVRSRAPHGWCLLSQYGNKYTLSLFKKVEYRDALTRRSQISGILSQWAHKLRKGPYEWISEFSPLRLTLLTGRISI